ncbi:MAG: mannose-1-phosphate guanylyltransferase [Candidatus Krumholzibacteria bacterium]|nr:mannose-1-phosphate guanylyltransferase [Candidatus Krumholzibacteria bacterium]
MYAVILAGGIGKRFWPFSTEKRPKQFLDITGKGPMLSVTFDRLVSLVDPSRILVLTVSGQLELIRETLPALPPENIFTEPMGRNTAPSLAVAAAMVKSRGDDQPVLCCPSDHLIRDTREFERVVAMGSSIVESRDVLVTFGIKPDHPATGYGYIEAETSLDTRNAGDHNHQEKEMNGVLKVSRFHEKPSLEKAREYLENGNFFWNSGIFMWKPSTFLAAFSEFLPEGIEPLEKIGAAFGSDGADDVFKSEYEKMPATSVDYGILEKASNVVVIPSDMGWDDVGSWDALENILPVDENGNFGTGSTVSIDSSNNIFFNRDGIIATVGIDGLVVAVKDGNVLVCRRGDSQRVKELFDAMENREEKN